MNISTRPQSGFTIVETLVAITVLMIAIAGPLVVASKGLFGADLAKDQMVASYLAQESLEMAKNQRDNNLYTQVGWLDGMNCTASSLCDLSPDGFALCSGSNPCPLYLHTYGYSNNVDDGTLSKFTRALYIHQPGTTAICSSNEECAVTVEVKWNEGATPYSVRVTSELTSILR